MTPVDSLKVGQWIAVCGDRIEQAMDQNPNLIRTTATAFTGEPCQIAAISLPFIAIHLPRLKSGSTIDVRRHEVVRLSRRYVKQMMRMKVDGDAVFTDDDAEIDGCPICGRPMLKK